MSLTEEWLECFHRATREELRDSIFWALALSILPEGVDGEDPRVKSALEEIHKAREEVS